MQNRILYKYINELIIFLVVQNNLNTKTINKE